MSKDDRAAYFRQWARERMKEQQVDGIYILICKQPAHLTVEIPARLEGQFNEKAKKELADLLLTNFREKKYDEGLKEAVKFVQETLAKSKEK